MTVEGGGSRLQKAESPHKVGSFVPLFLLLLLKFMCFYAPESFGCLVRDQMIIVVNIGFFDNKLMYGTYFDMKLLKDYSCLFDNFKGVTN